LPSAAVKAQVVKPNPSAGLFSSPEKRTFVLCLLLVVATLAVYNPITHNGFVNYDDDQYITQNPPVRAGLTWNTVKWAFTKFYQANWHPLTWLSHALDCQLFGVNPVGHHYMNVLLHAVNATLVFLLLQSATGFTWRSLTVAALFALHPVNVESVAWASERKNLLSLMFLLLAMRAYGWYARRPSAGRYAGVAILFALGLMSKPQIITLPFILLLWDYWPLQRMKGASAADPETAQPSFSFKQLVWEKVPLLGLSLASAIVTMKAQRAGGAIHSTLLYTLPLRLENAIFSYARYLAHLVWPTYLLPIYPYPHHSLQWWKVAGSALVLLAVSAAVLSQRKRKYLLVGWLWFLGALVPMIGVVQVGEQAMADRYAYLPYLGLFVILCWGATDWWQERKGSTAWLAAPAAIALAAMSLLSYQQIGYWRSGETLWEYAVRSSPIPNHTAHLNLAMAYDHAGRFDEAIPHLRAAMDPGENDPKIHLGLGIYDQRYGHMKEALEEYQATLDGSSDSEVRADAFSDMGSAYRQMHDYARAGECFASALRLNPNQPMALIGMGVLAQKSGDLTSAIADYSHAMAVEPTAVGYSLLANALETAGRGAEARAAYDKARQLTDDLGQAQQTAGQLLAF